MYNDRVHVLDTGDLLRSIDGSSDCEMDEFWPTLLGKLSAWKQQGLLSDYARVGQLRPVVISIDPGNFWVMGNGHHRLIANYVLNKPTIVFFDLEGDYYRHGISSAHWDDEGPDWLCGRY